jgi:2-desacetyl-2-hydroxyethyl bacteriochlorophyllide A dehydrogenase
MKVRVLYFLAPRRIEIRNEILEEPAAGEVRVETDLSAISAGTELLLYRGQLSSGTTLDENLPSLSGTASYPLAYGYAAVGRVVSPGDLLGRRVFAFETHRSGFVARAESLRVVPDSMDSESAALLPTFETAVSLVQDARPLLGERVLVLGQGVVGLATTALLSRFSLARLTTVDRWEARRRLSLQLGAHRSLAPEDLDENDFDLAIEVSGSPDALDLAIGAAGVEARVLVGSWYGEKRAELGLGTHFHRGRIRVQSSQVSRIAPRLSARWTKDRRLRLALDAIATVPPGTLVSHRFPIERAEEAYRLLDEAPESCLQVLLTYN